MCTKISTGTDVKNKHELQITFGFVSVRQAINALARFKPWLGFGPCTRVLLAHPFGCLYICICILYLAIINLIPRNIPCLQFQFEMLYTKFLSVLGAILLDEYFLFSVSFLFFLNPDTVLSSFI